MFDFNVFRTILWRFTLRDKTHKTDIPSKTYPNILWNFLFSSLCAFLKKYIKLAVCFIRAV